MHQLTRRSDISPAAARLMSRSRRRVVSTLALAALLGYQMPARAQTEVRQACYAIADNGGAGDPTGGQFAPDTLTRIDFSTGTVEDLATITGPNGPTNTIEAMSSRTNFDELIAPDENLLGRVSPADGSFTPLGSLGPFQDFDSIVVDLSSPNQTRLLLVSKDSNPARNNVLVEATLQIDENGRSVGVSAPRPIVQIPDSAFPPGTRSIDGIALSDSGILYGSANDGPTSPQMLVIIDQNTGALTSLAMFQSGDNRIDDVEDLSFDLFGNLFATSGSNFSSLADTGFIISLGNNGPVGQSTNTLSLASAGSDFEASACLPFNDNGDLLVVKRITAIVRDGVETRFESFVDQPGETDDNDLLAATSGAFPQGIVDVPETALPGDEVEYTVYTYNLSARSVNSAVLCDPVRPPGILQPDSIEFAPPTGDLALAFTDRSDFARAPLAPADTACTAALQGATQFLSGPPGPSGGLGVGAGGGVVTDEFDLAPQETTATRFRISVGQGSVE